MRKIYVVGNSTNYANWMEGNLVNNMEEADLVLFTGGEDVTPSFYNEPQHPRTYNSLIRDNVEKIEFNKAVELNKHIIGICRGSQFVCAMSGGKLVQHQSNPSYIHDIYTYDGNILEITSTHHQAQYPWNLPEEDYEILGWTKNMLPFHEDGNQQELPMASEKECEIVYYKQTKALGIQGHPEMMFDESHPTIIWLRELLNKHMSDTLEEEFVAIVE